MCIVFVNKCKYFEDNLKIKLLTIEQIIIAIDRLTRFKNTEKKYLRVFKELILHNLINPAFNKNDLDKMTYTELKNYAQEILNFAILNYTGKKNTDFSLNKKICEYEKSVYYIDKNTQELLDNKIDYLNFIELLPQKCPNNLAWLKELAKNTDIKKQRQNKGFYFPIELVIIAEGVTEETLLPEFARVYGFDFSKNGVFIIPAGGKNQVVKLYYELCETLKCPIFVLLDKDGIQNASEIEPKLRKTDKVYVLNCGEFEDALSQDLVNRTLNNELKNISETNIDLTEKLGHRVEYLEEIFKHRGMHEFKKADFSQMLKENIKSKSDLTPEIINIIEEIKKLKSND